MFCWNLLSKVKENVKPHNDLCLLWNKKPHKPTGTEHAKEAAGGSLEVRTEILRKVPVPPLQVSKLIGIKSEYRFFKCGFDSTNCTSFATHPTDLNKDIFFG